ncbi:polyamine transporter [Viridothelium virens]|uniref:Polyamine transporter n=1 Tax=Viridothelium virens TaxID=1048519 RepID=A0A6A6HCR2_VIRVR|nr:polyamine transporter [Viridothelium virens]
MSKLNDVIEHGHPASSPSTLLLIPQPSSNPEDPLNWTTFRKYRLLALVCLASFAGNVAALSGQFAYPVQSKTYKVTILESSYSVSAAISGLAAGAFFFVPLQRVFGRWAVALWSLVGSLACAIWSAKMTSEGDYVDFIISRLFSGLFGSVPSAFAGSMIIDVVFLHHRGAAFLTYEVAAMFGAAFGPTMSGFISGTVSWTWCFWWTVPFLCVTIILVFLFAEETAFDRTQGLPLVEIPSGWLSSRIALFAPGWKSVPKPTIHDVAKEYSIPVFIALSPIALLCGFFTLIAFGWVLLNDILSPTFLQTPVSEGGYGFTPIQNSAFNFCLWFSFLVGLLIGSLVNDRLPLWICKRFHNGIWKPEFRLYVTIITLILAPIGLGICGAALEYHLHYMVFALGFFLVGTAIIITVPVAVNYVSENFTNYSTQCTIVMTFYRLAWGVAIPFFADDWISDVGIGWVYGMAAFLLIAAWCSILTLLIFGGRLRHFSFFQSMLSTEEGSKVFVDDMRVDDT